MVEDKNLPDSGAEVVEAPKLDPKWLKGQTFTELQKQKVKDANGKTVTKDVPVARDLTEADVLAWSDKGVTVVIVTKDGQKLTVKK